MAGRRPIASVPVSRVQTPEVSDQTTQRALDALTAAVHDAQSKRARDVLEFDLIIGVNRIPHSLGRPCVGYTITPTVASAAFGHAIDRTNPRPDREVWIEIIGADQDAAIVEVF